ncbi:endopeptidase La [Halanaerobium hydrogeniformans]|uniref:Lon protease n=1 Tax=Halanaerobium hydrogeniformans TaxID=656519 RepID=E4RPW2_HALHG|nr:endopeptidase La [Halanaerobium hydrogeniformans]ADQ14329.1 ATP-dependent protease La [Halanaerobium hydrogeniformans]
MSEAIKSKKTMELPLLASRGVIVFPHMVIPLLVGRDKSIEALEEAMMEEKKIIIVAQKDEKIEDPEIDDIYSFGTIAEVKQFVKLPNDMMKVVVEGLERARVKRYIDTEGYFLAEVESCPEEKVEVDTETKALMRTVVKEFEQYIKFNRNLPAETIMSVNDIEDPGRLADVISSQIDLKYQQLQELLEATDIIERLEKMLAVLRSEIEVLKIEQDINKRVKKKVEKNQKEYYLREKMKVIKDELDEDQGASAEIAEYYEKLEEVDLPEKAAEKIEEEIKKLDRTPNMSPEATVIRNYLDFILDLPWNISKEDEIDIKKSDEILEADHYGLEDVKERIIEYLAVRKMAPAKKSPILCLVGAPGVGKTSLGRSIARALNREFVRLSLGGVKDEAEIRGHRRTYIGSRPGRILSAIKDAGTKNPVFLLDEVDKMSSDFRGDPASALLEVLDPEQNIEFSDHYLELPFDLSEVLFVTTANVAHTIPAPLLDRMELIEIPGYTEDEKLKIAEKHLLPDIYEDHGLKEDQINISSNAIYKVIREYTREAGVRNLERKLAAIARKVAREFLEGRDKKVLVAVNSVEKYLGLPDYEYQQSSLEDRVGVATGLAYNQAGGDILDIEVAVVPGKGELTLTGSLGDVMKESAQAALSYVRSKQNELSLTDGFYKNFDIHIHVPQGAVPKDGPSAGITIAIALASALTNRKVRGDYAMTGEISLRGRVLPIGGLKTKILAGRRAGLSKFILPQKNKNNYEEIDREITKDIEVSFVSHMDEVLEMLLCKEDENEIE